MDSRTKQETPPPVAPRDTDRRLAAISGARVSRNSGTASERLVSAETRKPAAGFVPPPSARGLLRRDLDRLARFFRIPRGRRLPADLRAERVGELAGGLLRGPFDPAFRMLLQSIDQSPILDGNRVQLFFGAPGAYDAMRRAIEAAREEILVEFYVLADEAGRRLADLLLAARARGVAVRVLADASHRGQEEPFWEPLRRGGVELKLFQPFFRSPWYRPPRDHRKILVVDRSVVFTGGRDSRLAPPAEHPVPALRDLYVRVEGSTALEMAVVFSDGWDRARGAELVFAPEKRPPAAHADGASVLVLDSPSWRSSREAASVLTAIVESARRSLWISNPCFAPKPFVIDALGRAAERGVDVRLLVPEGGDAPIARSASRGSYLDLLRRGVAIQEFPGASLQAKLMIADDYVSVLGSTNLDFRYFRLNAQCNLVIFESATARTLASAFERDLAASHRVTAESLAGRPFLGRAADELARELVTTL
ncbi:MAG TPA: phospholipase D-like domain-containing protein [Thermoanaerobaculia bacterium]|nr:phospholipase D-like domain-containing protein [Thermoanaerobaculia bacterium]